MNGKSSNRKIMSDAEREKRNAYYREWRRKNPEKVREINERYWRRRIEKEMLEEIIAERRKERE